MRDVHNTYIGSVACYDKPNGFSLSILLIRNAKRELLFIGFPKPSEHSRHFYNKLYESVLQTGLFESLLCRKNRVIFRIPSDRKRQLKTIITLYQLLIYDVIAPKCISIKRGV